MSALVVLIIRHAEKPGQAFGNAGLAEDGAPNAKSLVIRGWQRAGAWAALFGARLGGADYPQPGVIYAAKPDVDESLAKEPSQRPFETVRPLAGRLGLTPRTAFSKDDVTGLAAEVLPLTDVVLISWEHKKIVGTEGMLRAFLGDQQTFGVPTTWPDDRFDVVLRLDRALPEAPWSIRQLFPRLLAGDTDTPF